MGDDRSGSDDVATVRFKDEPPAPPPAERDAPPTVATAWADRYTLVRKLAEGGMGEVYIAYDERLDRRVAIKLLRQTNRSPEIQQRMQREAQALARLSHPNVVQVYDVGQHGDRLYVTMELVVGADLRGWWKAAPRTWREVLAVVLQAGEGLAAAHRAGLVHRDIKPDNLLVGDDGRVCVADFGLARADHGDEPPAPADAAHPGSLLDSPITEQGALVGTPAYMAPEQFLRRAPDVRSDVFALCVVLYEGVYGERPFRGKSWQQLAAATLAGTFRPPARDPPIPGWLARAIARGLAVDPQGRHPSVPALLAELRRPQQAARRRWLWTLGLGALGLGVGLGLAAAARPAPCASADAAAAALWTAERRDAVHAALVAVSPTAGAEVSQRVTDRLGRHVQALEDMSRETCLSYQDGALSDSLYDRARACLDRRADEVEALVSVLAAADAETVAHALTAADALRDLSACSDRAALLAHAPPPDPSIAAAVPALARRVDQVRALRLAGRYKDADALLGPLVADAAALAYAPLTAEAHLERALVGLELARIPEAIADLSAAAALAESAAADEHRLAALTAWLRAAGLAHQPAVFAALEPQALALIERRGETGRSAHGRVLLAAGEAALELELPADPTADRLTAAIAVFEPLGDPAAPQLAEALNDLAIVRSTQRRYPEAHAHYRRARDLLAASLGPHHPNLGFIANNEARAFDKEGDPASARTWFAAALDLWQPVYGPDHPNTLIARLHLARMSQQLGDHAAATDHAARVLAARARTSGETHTSLALPLQILARAALQRGDPDDARARAERALEILQRAHGDASPRLQETLAILLDAALASDRTDDAVTLAERRLALADNDRTRARAHLDVARARWARGEPEAARAAAALAAAALPDETAAWLAAHPPV